MIARYWVPFSACIAFLLFLFLAATPFFEHVKIALFAPLQVVRSNAIHSLKRNIWADLSKEEVGDLTNFLYSRAELNLTDPSKATSFDNTIRLVEVLQPNKTDALSYLNGSLEAPERWARVVINDGASDAAQIVNYMVGPLPTDKSTVVLPLGFCYNSDRNYVFNPIADEYLFQSYALSVAKNMSDVIESLLGGQVDLQDPNSLGALQSFSHIENGTIIGWLQIYRQGQKSGAMTILPQGFYVKIELSSRNPDDWKFKQLYYNRRLYDSVSDLRMAMKSPDFERTPLNIDGDWTDTEDLSKGLLGRQQPPPVMIQPEGPRFFVDENEKFITWMGFEFFITTSSDTGVALHDIRFGGESIIYELGLQEALAHYAGDDPQQGVLEFLDTTFLMGLRMFELVPGYDCPSYATYLSTMYHLEDISVTNKNSICIFEYTADHVLSRHTTDFQVSISRNTYLVVRSVSTVGNYDYTIDYMFYLDGTVEVKVRASGFIFGAFWAPVAEKKMSQHGYRVHDALATSMHDHVINFKADLDIAGTANTLKRVSIEPVTLEFPWDDEITTPRNTMQLVSTLVQKEVGLDWPRNSGEMYIVTNEDSENAWGEKRGYRIAAGTGMGNPSHLSILNSTRLGKSADWATRDLWFVKQKDTEPKSGSALNFFDPLDPLVDFSKFVNDENIEQEDLVVYFNLGSHHIPHSGDIPNTLMHTSASSVMFTPFNFHDRDPSRRSVQGVKLAKGPHGAKPQYFGETYKKSMKIEQTDLEPDLSQYDTEQHFSGHLKNWTWIPGLIRP